MKKFLFFLVLPQLLNALPHISGKYGCQEKTIISSLPKTGTISIIFLRIEFSDVKSNNQDFEGYMNNMRNYYQVVSNGKLNLVSTITQVFTLTNTMGYYGNPEKPMELKNDAIATATLSGINLSSYDSIMILHAGAGEETGYDTNQIYSRTLTGTISIIPEMENYGISPFGVWCHEFGHQLGLPDMNTVGAWSLMDIGCYNGQGEYPSWPDPYSKINLNWVNQISTTTLILAPENNNVYQLGILGIEAFLVEKRSEPGLLGNGFLVWYYKGVLGSLERINILQADGGNLGDSGDPFPGSTRNYFLDDYSNPSLRYSNGDLSGFRIEILIPHPPKAKAFPNPIDLNKTKRVFFEVERGAILNIYNIKGEKIKGLYDSQNTGRIYWDIDNIASGVYIFIVKDKDGNKSFGKLGVIK